MAEAIVILGAIRNMTSTLLEFADLVDRYKRLPDRIYDLQENLHACELTLRSWKNKWGVTDRHPNLYYEIFWSKKGWEAIRICLGNIGQICKVVQDKLNAICNVVVKFSTTEDRRHYRGSFDRRMFERTIERIERHYSWPRRFSNAITQRADDLDKYLVRFDNRLRNLQRFSDGYLSINHPDLYGKDPKYLREKGMRLLGESAKKEVLEARKDANALYRAYTAGDDLRCHLALATLQERRAKPASVPERDFQFLLSNDINTYEIVAHPINYPDTSARRRLPSTLADAFRAVSRDSQEPADLLPPKASKGHGFVLSIAERAKLSNIQRQQPLSMLIKAASINARDGFNYRDRIAVAGTLVEGCHRLLGTPWLDHLDSNNIRGLKARDQAWTAMLGFNNRGKQSVAETLSEMATGRAGVSIHHCQIFRLGLVLIEVALGALVSYIEISPDPWAPGVNVVIRDLGGDQKLPAMTIAAAVEKETSVLYGDMVFFCLSVLQSADKMRAPDLDLQYDEYIMKPACKLGDLLT